MIRPILAWLVPAVVLLAGTPGASAQIGPAAVSAAPTDSIPEAVVGELGRSMDALVARAAPFGFSGQVLVEVDGRVVLHRAYGFADPAAGRALGLETGVGVASISKSFAAAAILALERAGALAVTDSLGRFFPAAPADKRGITIHQLLTHTSGLAAPLDDDFEAASRDELVASILVAPLQFAPGSAWRYATAGYNLAAAIVEIASGRPYEEYLRETIFEPAGMRRTRLLDEVVPGGDVARARLGWDDRGAPPEWPRNWRNFGAGDLVSTAADLLRWERALRDGTVLPPAAVGRMTSVQAEVDEGVGYGYGYGFFLHGEPGRRVREHGGDAALGYNGSFYRYLDEDFTVVITSASRTANGEYTRHAFGQSLESLARGDSVELPPEAAPPMAVDPATFRGPAGGRLHLITDGAHAWLAADGQAAVDALAPPAPEDAADLARAAERTAALVAGLQARDPAAHATALGEAGASHLDDYRAEWRGLVESRGPLHAWRDLGTTLRGTIATTRVWLRFRDGAATMSFFWSDRAAGRLVGTFVESTGFRPPYAIPLGRRPDGGWVAHDLMSGRTARVEIDAGGLTIEGTGERWVADAAPASWAPPFRP